MVQTKPSGDASEGGAEHQGHGGGTQGAEAGSGHRQQVIVTFQRFWRRIVEKSGGSGRKQDMDTGQPFLIIR